MVTCTADTRTDEEMEHHVLEVACLQPDQAGHDNPHCFVLWHHVSAEGPPSQDRYSSLTPLPGPSPSTSLPSASHLSHYFPVLNSPIYLLA